MARRVSLGIDNFCDIRRDGQFYIDKTNFIKEWWELGDRVTLITRPRRVGKTLNMSMLECFFSNEYVGRGDLFEGLFIWKDKDYQCIQGTYPVISLSFANVKETDYSCAVYRICGIIKELYERKRFLLKCDMLSPDEKVHFKKVTSSLSEKDAPEAIYRLCSYLSRYYKKRVIVLLDEYDTPMQEAYLNGYWEELSDFTRSLFNSTFKTNSYLERAVMTGITRIGRESIFSDLNNLRTVTATSEFYAEAFGFTQEEVFASLEEQGLGEHKAIVKEWYDGFRFGRSKDIYNPWSVISFLSEKKLKTYWANTSSNRLVGKVIQEGNAKVKIIMENLLSGKSFVTELDEQIVFDQLNMDENAIWSLLVAGGYLKIEKYEMDDYGNEEYTLGLTNFEVKLMFEKLIKGWFKQEAGNYNDFIKALLQGDVHAMNIYMNRIAMQSFSYFDTGNRASEYIEPERFYHGFVLGLLVDLKDKYILKSNRESGFGRYDVMLKPLKKSLPAIVMEFKVHDAQRESSLEETVNVALKQIKERQYDMEFYSEGITKENVRHYGFAFKGKEVLIG